MSNEVNKTFFVSVKFSKETPGNLEDDVGFDQLIKKIFHDSVKARCIMEFGFYSSRQRQGG